jgi:hypothetical protein
MPADKNMRYTYTTMPQALKGFRPLPIVLSIIVAVTLFYIGEVFPSIQNSLLSLSYVGTFIVGILYAESFTSPSATALLLIFGQHQNLWVGGTIASFGAVFGDLVVFELFRSSKRFSDDNPKHQEKYAAWREKIKAKVPERWHTFVIASLVAIFLILPLPNEFADFLLARTRKITTEWFLVISYALNAVGIYAIFWLGRLI